MSDEQNKKNDWNIRPYLALGLVMLLVIVLCITYYFIILRYDGISENWAKAKRIVQPIIFGIVFAYLVNPIVNFVEKFLDQKLKISFKTKKKRKSFCRTVSILAALVFVFLILGFLFRMIMPQVYISIEGLVTNLPAQVNHTIAVVQSYIASESQFSQVLEDLVKNGTDYLDNWVKTSILPQAKDVITQVTTGVYSVIKVLFNALIGLIVSIYLLYDKEKFLALSKKTVYAVCKPKAANILVDTLRKSHEIFIGFISGKILDSLIIGLLTFIVLTIVNMPYAMLVSVIVGVTNVIPFFGPYIGAIPSFFIILLADPMKSLYFLIIILIIQQVDGNIIGPKILGDSTGLSAFWVVFAILVGGGFFGVIGMLIGVPVFAVIYHIIGRMIRYFLKRKNLPEGTKIYANVKEIDEQTNQLVYQTKKK